MSLFIKDAGLALVRPLDSPFCTAVVKEHLDPVRVYAAQNVYTVMDL